MTICSLVGLPSLILLSGGQISVTNSETGQAMQLDQAQYNALLQRAMGLNSSFQGAGATPGGGLINLSNAAAPGNNNQAAGTSCTTFFLMSMMFIIFLFLHF